MPGKQRRPGELDETGLFFHNYTKYDKFFKYD